MTLGEKIIYTKIKKLNENGGRCEVCGQPLALSDCQLAHRVPKTKGNLRTYGPAIIHHELNLACVCSLRCNSAVLLNLATRPVEAQALIDRIKKELTNGNHN